MTTFNADIPEEFTDKAMPTEAVVGHLHEDQTTENFVEAMTQAGIDDTRIHILTGEDGVAVLQNMGTRLGRLFGPDREKPIELLRNGATLVGVFGVPDDEQASTSKALNDAEVNVLHRFGKWTYT